MFRQHCDDNMPMLEMKIIEGAARCAKEADYFPADKHILSASFISADYIRIEGTQLFEA